MDVRPTSPFTPAGKVIVGLFYFWLASFLGALGALTFIEPVGDGLNRAIPTVSLVGLATILSFICALKTRVRRRTLRKRAKSLGYLPLLVTALTFLSLIDHIVRGDGAFIDPLAPADRSSLEEDTPPAVER